jgi:aryl-alcohol dehydrogenase-like predicted oxidoreductase
MLDERMEPCCRATQFVKPDPGDAAAMRVPSKFTIGTSSFGRATRPGSTGEAQAAELAEVTLTSGHAYVDTSNNYADGRSESVLGLAIKRFGRRRSTDVITRSMPTHTHAGSTVTASCDLSKRA